MNSVRDWLESAYYDLLVIENIIENPHLTHMVAFHAQQSVEKSLKALMEHKQMEIPKVHTLVRLNHMLDDIIRDIETLKILDSLYIDSRYPGELGLLPYGKPTLEDAKAFYEFAQSVFDMICEFLQIDKNGLIGKRT